MSDDQQSQMIAVLKALVEDDRAGLARLEDGDAFRSHRCTYCRSEIPHMMKIVQHKPDCPIEAGRRLLKGLAQ